MFEKIKDTNGFKLSMVLVAFVLVLTTILGLIFDWFSVKKDNVKDNATEQAVNMNTYGTFATEFVSTGSVQLMSVSPMSTVTNGTYAEQTIMATVLPTSASNKLVDWSVAWGGEQTGNVTDYVTVTPSTSGSTTASIKCYQAFEGNIVVTVTTREGGFSADCIVTFVGIPTEINVNGPFSESDDGFYYIGVGNTYSFNVDVSNVFGTIGEDYRNVNMTLGGVGSIVLGTYESTSEGSKWYDTSLTTVELQSMTDKFLSASFENGVLNITTFKAVESYYETLERIDGGRTRYYTNKFKEYASNDAYFYVRLEVQNTGLSKVIKIKFDENVVANVEVNKSEIVF